MIVCHGNWIRVKPGRRGLGQPDVCRQRPVQGAGGGRGGTPAILAMPSIFYLQEDPVTRKAPRYWSIAHAGIPLLIFHGCKSKIITSGKIFYRSRPIHACSDMNNVWYFPDHLTKQSWKSSYQEKNSRSWTMMKEKISETIRNGA